MHARLDTPDHTPERAPKGNRTHCARIGVLCIAALVQAGAAVSPADAQEAVLYVTEALADRVTAYRIGKDGRVAALPFDSISTGPDSNPRRLAVHPDGCALYVATKHRVEAFQIMPSEGKLRRFRDDEDTLSQMRGTDPANFQFLAVHPDGYALYAAAAHLDQIHQYNLNGDGSLARAFTTVSEGGTPTMEERDPPITSCVQGVEDVRYQGLAATDTHLYASAHLPYRVDIFPLEIEDPSELGAIMSCSDFSEESGAGCGSTNEEPAQVFDCNPRQPNRDNATFAPDFSRNIGNPKTLLLNDARDTLYIADRFNLQIYACPIAPDGGLPDCPRKDKNDDNNLERVVLKTKISNLYEQLALSDDGVLFATVFQSGTVRAFVPKPEKKRLKRKKKKASDVFATPVGLAAYDDTLYVAQGELDRIDAFKINASGLRKGKPKWSTSEVKGAFPNGVLVVKLNTDPAACGRDATPVTTSSTTHGISSTASGSP